MGYNMKYISSIHGESERYINKTALWPYASKSDMEEISLSNLRKRSMQWKKYHHLSIILLGQGNVTKHVYPQLTSQLVLLLLTCALSLE
jgi:hypothetical protein